MTQEKSYKDSLNLPKTDFPMKAGLAVREPERLKHWGSKDLYGAIRSKAGGKPLYILHDGPPYANGHIHIGHALNKVLKDIIVKYKSLRGFDAFYVPGWDCHGLPIEHACLKEMGKRKEQVDRVEFRKQARAYAENFVGIQREEFKRLGIFGQWEEPYLTMNFGYQAEIAASFLRLAEKGYVYQGQKPVPWCFDCETALADAELEYEDKVSQSVFVKFPADMKSVVSKIPGASNAKEISFLVWTTTPWTLPANVGIALHPELKYMYLEKKGQGFIFAESLHATLAGKMDLDGFESKGSVSGKELEGAVYAHPFLDRQGRTIMADYVSATDGTGIVHIAPGHGEDDYIFGHQQNKLEVLSPVDEKGRFTKEFAEAEGVHVFKANKQIIEILKQKEALLADEQYGHSYPHCWRCKKPIIFRATKQWFMKIDHEDLRQKMLGSIKGKIKFTPDWGKNRIGSMVETRPEWCLSRQRYWGVPIPMILCAQCPEKTFVKESKDKIKEIFVSEGADAWFARAVRDFLPAGFKCPDCGSAEFVKEDDIIDVWFDSGVSHQAVLKTTKGLKYPADLYLEGSDQHRGWFQSALTTAMALEGNQPFEGVLTHGFVVDGEGKKMSKSAGNVVAPQDVMKQFGADILRLWVSSCDYELDVRLSQDILKQLADSYRKIRNTFRYMLSNLYDFDPAKHALVLDKLHPLDRWALYRTDRLIQVVEKAYEEFNFHKIYREIHNFCTLDLSSYYFDILKDTLYTAKTDSFLRRSAQTSIFHILKSVVKLIAPILAFTSDEVWQAYDLGEGESVHTSGWPVCIGAGTVSNPADELLEWEHIRAMRDAITLLLEKKRESKQIGSSLDAKICLKAGDEEIERILKAQKTELARIFIVSQIEIADEHKQGMEDAQYAFPAGHSRSISIQVVNADGSKCARCWNYSTVVGTNAEHPDLCGKCLEAIA